MPKEKAKTAITGACGEHYVAAYLSRHKLAIGLPRAGVKGSDLFVTKPDSGRPLRVQVKTASNATGKDKNGAYYSWDTKCPSPEFCNDATWYAYVSLKDWPKEDGVLPEIFFIPSAVVRDRMLAIAAGAANKKSSWTRTFFWMYADDIRPYKGKDGLAKLMAAIQNKPAKAVPAP